MKGYSSAKPYPAQFRVPFHKYSSCEDHNDLGESFYNTLSSWLNFRNVSRKSVPEVDQIYNVFSAIFQANGKQVVKGHGKGKFGRTPNVIKIDLDKIDRNLKLTDAEKKRLVHILKVIKYEDLTKQPNRKEVKNVKVKQIYRKTINTVNKEKSHGEINKIKQPMEKYRERKSLKDDQCKYCVHSLGDKPCAESIRSRCLANITPSEERIFKALINMDRSCCGDSFKSLLHPKNKNFETQKQSINIENLEFKYIQPTCIIRCKSKEKGPFFNLVSQSMTEIAKKVSFTPSAKECNNTRNCCFLDLHMTKNSPTDIVGPGCRREKNMSACTFQDGEIDSEKNTLSSKSFCDVVSIDSEARKHLLTYDQPRSHQSFEESHDGIPPVGKERFFTEQKTKNKTSSKYRKLINFARKCFCFCGTADECETSVSRQRRKYRKVNAKLKTRLNSPNRFMTDQGFLNRKKEMMIG